MTVDFVGGQQNARQFTELNFCFLFGPTGTRNRVHVHRKVGMHAYVSGSYTQNEVTSPMFFVHVSEFKQARHLMIKISTLYMQPW